MGRRRGSLVRAGKDPNEKIKREQEKADFSALWALRIKNFFSTRRKYLEQADQSEEPNAAEKKLEKELAEEEAQLRRQRDEIMATRLEELQAQGGDGLNERMVASDIARARFELQSSPLAKATLAVVRVRELLRAVLLLPFTLVGAAFRAWQGLFNSQRYENFLMSEGESLWYWRNRTENERWFWEVFVWDRLLFPILAVACYEYLVPNQLLWAVVVPLALLTWLQGELPGPASPEFWLVAYFGFYRKCWPDVAAALGNFMAAAW